MRYNDSNRPIGEFIMPVLFNEAMYPKVKQWLLENPQDKSLSKLIKQSLLDFETLTEPEKKQLQTALLAMDDLPDVIQQFMPDRLGALPNELLDMVGNHLTPKDRRELATADTRMYSVFHQSNLHAKFLECVAYGQQDKAERLLSQVFQGQPTKIQAALLHQGTLTTYAGETFNCSAYEYAYWAKDTHMCRMLERYMDDETKAAMAARIDEMERIDEANGQPIGLVYSQAGREHRSANFDFTPLKEAYQRYLAGYDAWFAANDLDAMDSAWWDVGKAQRRFPAHVAQEYCRPDRSFDPRPEFNEATLPRVLTFYDRITRRDDSWFPLAASNSGRSFLAFALIRGGAADVARVAALRADDSLLATELDLAAITRLDEVRTVDLTQSREHLNPPAISQSMTV